MPKKKALLVLNGKLDLKRKEIIDFIENKNIDKIIAVDGGANKIKKLDLIPDLIIGDLDSLTQINKEYYQKQQVKIIKHPVEKDQTDSELAVDYCLKENFDKLYLISALGGRVDQQLANINLLEYINELSLKAEIISKNVEIAVIETTKKFINKKGYRLSLIPQTKEIKGLKIKGCKYNLESRDIYRSKSRGISNLIERDQAEISLESGLLIYVLENIE